MDLNKIVIILSLTIFKIYFAYGQIDSAYCHCESFPANFSSVDTLLIYQYSNQNYERIVGLWYNHFGQKELSNYMKGSLAGLADINNSILKKKFKKFVKANYSFIDSTSLRNHRISDRKRYLFYFLPELGCVVLDLRTKEVLPLLIFDDLKKDKDFYKCINYCLTERRK